MQRRPQSRIYKSVDWLNQDHYHESILEWVRHVISSLRGTSELLLPVSVILLPAAALAIGIYRLTVVQHVVSSVLKIESKGVISETVEIYIG